ncbi:hypothetical protein Hanom_Chr12g01077231 [Helianthus anomalus]
MMYRFQLFLLLRFVISYINISYFLLIAFYDNNNELLLRFIHNIIQQVEFFVYCIL